jgi:hypothetical protein
MAAAEVEIPTTPMLAWGDALPSARVHAQATGRQLRELRDAVAAESHLEGTSAQGAFLWLPERDLTYQRAAWYANRSAATGTAIGLMPVGDGVGIDPARGRYLPASGRVLGWPVPGGNIDDFLRELHEGVGAVVIGAHGNGVDFGLSSDTVLCAQADPLAPAPATAGERFLPCHQGGPCFRERMGFHRRVGAGAVRAGLVVLASCWGTLPVDGWLTGRLSLSYALLRGQAVRAVVTSISPAGYPPLHRIVAQLGRLLAQGISSGMLACWMNRQLLRGSFLCLGDPDVHLPAEARPIASAKAGAPSRPAPSRAELVTARLVAADLLQMSRPVRSFPQAMRIERLRREACRLALASALGSSPSSLPAAGLPTAGRWGRAAAAASSPCPTCGQPGTVHPVRSAVYACTFELAGCELHPTLTRVVDDPGTERGAPPAVAQQLVSAWRIRCLRESALSRDGSLPAGFRHWLRFARRLEESALDVLAERGPAVVSDDEHDREMAHFFAWALNIRALRAVKRAPLDPAVKPRPHPERHSCGNPVLGRTYLWRPWTSVRVVLDCLRCGPFAEGPQGRPLPVLTVSGDGRAAVDLSALPRTRPAWVALVAEPWVYQFPDSRPIRVHPAEGAAVFTAIPEAPDGSQTRKVAAVISEGDLWLMETISGPGAGTVPAGRGP